VYICAVRSACTRKQVSGSCDLKHSSSRVSHTRPLEVSTRSEGQILDSCGSSIESWMPECKPWYQATSRSAMKRFHTVGMFVTSLRATFSALPMCLRLLSAPAIHLHPKQADDHASRHVQSLITCANSLHPLKSVAATALSRPTQTYSGCHD